MIHRLTFSLCYWRQVWTCYGKKSICFPHMDNERGWNECQDFHHRALEVYLVLVVLSSQFFNLPSTKHKRDAVITSPPFLWLLQLARCKMWSYLIFKYDAFQSECWLYLCGGFSSWFWGYVSCKRKEKSMKKHWFSLFTCMDGGADIDPMTLS